MSAIVNTVHGFGLFSYRNQAVVKTVKLGISGLAINLQTMSIDKWATSKSTQLSTKVCVKLLLLFENALKLNFEAL